MEQNEITAALHTQLKAAAQSIFAGLNIKPGNYTAAEVDKTLNLSGQMASIAAARFESRQYPATEECNAKKIACIMSDLDIIGITCEPVTISVDSFTASMPATLVFAKLVQWEREFKIKTADKAVFVKEEEGEVIASCIVEFPKEAKYIAEYAGTDPTRPLLMGVLLDTVNGCIVATDTHVLTEIPVTISDIEGEALNLIIDPKIIKAVAGQRCEVKLMKDAENNISIKTDKGDVYTCENIKGNYPAYRHVYPKVNRDGLAELTKEGAKALANFAKGTVKQTKDTRGGNATIKIEIPAYSSEGTATYYDDVYQTKKSVKFAVKGSPCIDIVFGIHAFSLSIITKNWSGSMWFADPSRPIVFDNINTVCTIVMPMNLTDGSANKSGHCAGVVDALKRHNYDASEAEATEHQQKEEKRISEESATISRAEKEESAKRYISIKGSGYEFIELTGDDEIIATTPNGCLARYVGKFRRSVDIVLFDCKENHISIPKEEPQTPQISTETPKPTKVSAEEERREETANMEPMWGRREQWGIVINRYDWRDINHRPYDDFIGAEITLDTSYYGRMKIIVEEIIDWAAGKAFVVSWMEDGKCKEKVWGVGNLFAELSNRKAEIKWRCAETPPDPPEQHETTPPTEAPPERINAGISVSPPPPDITPPKQIIILTPPKYKPSNTLINHDWNSSLAPPYNMDYEPRHARDMDNIINRCPCYPPAYVACKLGNRQLCNSPPPKDRRPQKSKTLGTMGRDRPTSRARPGSPTERKDRTTQATANTL